MIKSKLTTVLLVLLDIIAVIVAFNAIAVFRGIVTWQDPVIGALFLPILAHLVAVHLIDGYSPRTDMISAMYSSLHAIALISVLLFVLLLTYVIVPPGFSLQSSRSVNVVAYLVLIPLTISYRRLIYQDYLRTRSQSYFLFVGSAESCQAFDEDCRKSGMQQAVLFATHEIFPPGAAGGAHAGPPVGEVVQYLEKYRGRIDAIILRESSLELPGDVTQKLIALQFEGIPTYTLELFHQIYWRKIPLYRLNQTWLFQEGFQIAREPVFARLKRISDIVLATIGIGLGLVCLPFIAAAIWLEDRGPVFFSQPRVGQGRRIFSVHKFRSMRNQAGGDDYTRDGDCRITRVGRFLRVTRLDELPQLWNVLRGEMSLIGPRAEWLKLVREYETKIPCYHFRHLVKPGITGWAQINYPYGESIDDTLRKLEYDLYYIRHFSFILDASIVLRTVHIMLFGKGR